AARLGRDANRLAAAKGRRLHFDGLDVLAIVQPQQELGGQAVDRVQAAHFLAPLTPEPLAQSKRQIGHRVRVEHAPPVQPVEDLTTPIRRLAPLADKRLELFREQADQAALHDEPNYARSSVRFSRRSTMRPTTMAIQNTLAGVGTSTAIGIDIAKTIGTI